MTSTIEEPRQKRSKLQPNGCSVSRKDFGFYNFHLKMLRSLTDENEFRWATIEKFLENRRAMSKSKDDLAASKKSLENSIGVVARLIALRHDTLRQEHEKFVAEFKAALASAEKKLENLKEDLEKIRQSSQDCLNNYVKELLAADVQFKSKTPVEFPTEKTEELKVKINLWEKLVADLRMVS